MIISPINHIFKKQWRRDDIPGKTPIMMSKLSGRRWPMLAQLLIAAFAAFGSAALLWLLFLAIDHRLF